MNSIVTGYGNGTSGKGVALWDLDNEPAWWDAVHRDVHPSPSTYDEVTYG
ncbi:MAG: glycoside hydrolase family 44 protein, partial [Dissulfurispiraceae bacterium]